MPELDGKQAVVVGASRGLGRGIAGSLSVAGVSDGKISWVTVVLDAPPFAPLFEAQGH